MRKSATGNTHVEFAQPASGIGRVFQARKEAFIGTRLATAC